MTTESEAPAMDVAPVVALHSSASCATQWKTLVAQLHDWRNVIAPDLPGYGGSGKRDPFLKGMSAVAEPIVAEIEKLGSPVHLVGHSFGGGVALKVAQLRPDLVNSLALYEPAVFHVLNNDRHSKWQPFAALLDVEYALNAAISRGCSEAGMQAFVDFWSNDQVWHTMPAALRDKVTSLAPVVSADFECIFAETWALEDLVRLKIPTYILTGLESPAVAQRTSALIAQHIPFAQQTRLPGLGHMAPVLAPEDVNPHIQEFIRNTERSLSHAGSPLSAAA